MDVELYDKDGCCLRCKGTNTCISCGGTGEKEDGSTCPTCYGDGDCKFCHTGKKEVVE